MSDVAYEIINAVKYDLRKKEEECELLKIQVKHLKSDIMLKDTGKIEIVKTHIENDTVNKAPTLVFTDVVGTEWVHSQDGNHWMKLVKKTDSWYFKSTTQPPTP